MFRKYLLVFLISMVPLVELRGAIPYAKILGLPSVPSYIICIIGNMLPVAFIYLFARKILEWGKDRKVIGSFCRFCLDKGHRAGEKLKSKSEHGLFIALMLFVGIPIPGTGAWTGTLGASMLDLGLKKSTLAVMLGVMLAGLIVLLASTGVIDILGGA